MQRGFLLFKIISYLTNRHTDEESMFFHRYYDYFHYSNQYSDCWYYSFLTVLVDSFEETLWPFHEYHRFWLQLHQEHYPIHLAAYRVPRILKVKYC